MGFELPQILFFGPRIANGGLHFQHDFHSLLTMLERRRKAMMSWASRVSWLARAARRSCGFDDRRSVHYANGATTGEINSSCAGIAAQA